MDNYYQVLGLDPSASQADVKRAFRELALKYHPDQHPSAIANDLFRKIKEAYEVLRDVDSRNAYDARLNASAYASLDNNAVEPTPSVHRTTVRSSPKQPSSVRTFGVWALLVGLGCLIVYGVAGLAAKRPYRRSDTPAATTFQSRVTAKDPRFGDWPKVPYLVSDECNMSVLSLSPFQAHQPITSRKGRHWILTQRYISEGGWGALAVECRTVEPAPTAQEWKRWIRTEARVPHSLGVLRQRTKRRGSHDDFPILQTELVLKGGLIGRRLATVSNGKLIVAAVAGPKENKPPLSLIGSLMFHTQCCQPNSLGFGITAYADENKLTLREAAAHLFPSTTGPSTRVPGPQRRSFPTATDAPRGFSCVENGSCYGDISTDTDFQKTVNVHGYYRRDGTQVRRDTEAGRQ